MTAGLALLASVIALAAPAVTAPATAQDTLRTGVHIGLNYQPGTKPGVLVLPIAGAGGIPRARSSSAISISPMP